MVDENGYSKLLDDIKLEFPQFKIIKKDESKFMKAIDLVLKTITLGKMNTFMSSFITTIGNTVYVPKSWSTRSPSAKAITMRHERVHMRQAKNTGRVAFSLLYLLAPLPAIVAHYRTKFEKEAYEESLRALKEYYGKKFFTQTLKDNIVNHFISAEYFWMWPWKKDIENWYDDTVKKILEEK